MLSGAPTSYARVSSFSPTRPSSLTFLPLAHSFPVPWPHDASARTLHPLPGPAQCPSPVQREHGPPRNDELVACLRELSTAEMYDAARVLTDDSPVNAWWPYYPVLEGESLLPRSPSLSSPCDMRLTTVSYTHLTLPTIYSV